MAKNVKINNVTYSNVPSVNIPNADGSGSAVFYDTSNANAQAQHIVSGYTAYGSAGLVTGSATFPTISQDGSTKVLHIT